MAPESFMGGVMEKYKGPTIEETLTQASSGIQQGTNGLSSSRLSVFVQLFVWNQQTADYEP